MLGQVHDHIVSELNQSARTDTIFVVTAVVFNLIVMGINSGMAAEGDSASGEAWADVVLGVFIAMSLLVNSIAIAALFFGRGTRNKLLKARCDRDDEYAPYIAMMQLVQAYGRGVRAPDDHCETFIIDDNIKWFIKRYRHLAPKWFREAYVQTGDLLPKPPKAMLEKTEKEVRLTCDIDDDAPAF